MKKLLNLLKSLLKKVLAWIKSIIFSDSSELGFEGEWVDPELEAPLNALYSSYLDMIESQLHQIEIDHALDFISDAVYAHKKNEIGVRLAEIKANYIEELNNLYLNAA